MEINKKYNNKFAYIGVILGLSLILIGGFMHSILGRGIICVPILTIIISLLALMKSERKDSYSKGLSVLGLLIGLTYSVLYFTLNMYK